eukprot:779540-Alexandrium_andersonii.AAC.1
MSASLVGSEMCIRDSPHFQAAPDLQRAPCEGSPPTQESQIAAPLLGAVSYTHLTLPTICSV